MTGRDNSFYLVFGGRLCLCQSDGGGPGGFVMPSHLDVPDLARLVTLIAATQSDGVTVAKLDGVTWDRFTDQLLPTAEAPSPEGGVFVFALDANGSAADGKITPLPALGSGG